jgi:hypothetical protein
MTEIEDGISGCHPEMTEYLQRGIILPVFNNVSSLLFFMAIVFWKYILDFFSLSGLSVFSVKILTLSSFMMSSFALLMFPVAAYKRPCLDLATPHLISPLILVVPREAGPRSPGA